MYKMFAQKDQSQLCKFNAMAVRRKKNRVNGMLKRHYELFSFEDFGKV